MSDFIKKEYPISYQDHQLYGELYVPVSLSEKYPLIILSHGMYASYTMTAQSAQELAKKGFACYCFDFKGCSYTNRSGGDLKQCSILTECDELLVVIDYLKKQEFVDSDRIYLLGQSLGGVVSSLAAANRKDEIKALVLMYPAFLMKDYVHGMFPSIDAVPDVVENYMGIPNLNLGRRFFTDILRCPFFDTIREYKKPVLVVHGTADLLVPMEYAKKAEESFNETKLVIVEGAEHGFQLDNDTVPIVTDFLRG